MTIPAHPLLIAAFCLGALPALAQDARAVAQGAPDVDCDNAMTQMDMTFCAEQEWSTADAELNAAWTPAMERMRALDEAQPAAMQGAAEALRAAQRAWIEYRDLACTAEGYQNRGGSMEAMVVHYCRARLTEQRTEDLRALAEQM